MKKILLFIAALFMVLTYGNSQNTAPYWSLVGNSNATAASKLGTTNAIPLRFFTNNVERMRIDATGKVGIGIINPVAIFTVKSSGGTPVSSWLNVGSTPVFAGFSENKNGELNIGTASVLPDNRAVFQGKRSRGTLAAPTAVVNDDYLLSFVASGYDGSAFQNPATISFYVDGAPTAGNVPGRISFVTGSNTGNRQERLKVGSTGNFDFNNGQVYLQQSTGFLGVGTTSPAYKLHVTAPYTAVYGNSTSGSFGVWGNSTYIGVYGTGDTYGVYGYNGNGNYSVAGYNSSTTGGYGIYGFSSGTNGYGVYGTASGTQGRGVYGNGLNGVYGNCVVGGGNGVYANANAASAYGVIAVSIQSIGISAYSGNASSYAGYFSGKVYSSGGYTGSDRKLKKDITEVSNAMNIIKKLQPRHYQFRQDGNYKYMNLPQGSHYGLIAQDVEQVLPNLVTDAEFNTAKLPDLEDEQAPPSMAVKPGEPAISVPIKPRVTKERKDEIISFKAMNYTELIPIMIKAMQEQQQQIDEQQLKIQELNQQVSQLLTEKNINSSMSNIILEQNSPNPYNRSTGIKYAIPSGFKTATLIITDNAGKRIKQVRLIAGSGVVTLDGSLLSSGAYSYSLMIDGKIVETKKMLVAK